MKKIKRQILTGFTISISMFVALFFILEWIRTIKNDFVMVGAVLLMIFTYYLAFAFGAYTSQKIIDKEIYEWLTKEKHYKKNTKRRPE